MDYSELLTTSKYLFHFESVYVIITLLIFDLCSLLLLCFVYRFVYRRYQLSHNVYSSFKPLNIKNTLCYLNCFVFCFSCLYEKLPLSIFSRGFMGYYQYPFVLVYPLWIFLFICLFVLLMEIFGGDVLEACG